MVEMPIIGVRLREQLDDQYLRQDHNTQGSQTLRSMVRPLNRILGHAPIPLHKPFLNCHMVLTTTRFRHTHQKH